MAAGRPWHNSTKVAAGRLLAVSDNAIKKLFLSSCVRSDSKGSSIIAHENGKDVFAHHSAIHGTRLGAGCFGKEPAGVCQFGVHIILKRRSNHVNWNNLTHHSDTGTCGGNPGLAA